MPDESDSERDEFSRQDLLETLEAVAGEQGGHVGADRLARALDAPVAVVLTALESLEDLCLVAGSERGWRLTVTGRELLALEREVGGVCVVDPPVGPPDLEQ